VMRPIISTREVTTQVVVSNGSTLVIGGLVKDSDSETINKIPYLADIPLLGKLFRKRTGDRQKTEVVVFLTVDLVGPTQPLTAQEQKAFEVRSEAPRAAEGRK
jgi:pilus assembly protein CpaC